MADSSIRRIRRLDGVELFNPITASPTTEDGQSASQTREDHASFLFDVPTPMEVGEFVVGHLSYWTRAVAATIRQEANVAYTAATGRRRRRRRRGEPRVQVVN